jgi:aryl-alcohol dehydrogenase-like predicted oxidoreductase
VLAHTVLQKGLLTGKITPGHYFNEGDHRANNSFFTPDHIAQIDGMLESIRPIADRRGISVTQLAINWTMQQVGITAVLVGARNVQQVRDNAGALAFVLTPEESSAIRKAVEQTPL